MTAGEEGREVLVLDDQINFFRYEHALSSPENPNIQDRFLPCNEHQNGCPTICKNMDSNPYYCMYLTVIDLEPYTIKNGQKAGDVIPWSRKLFTVKSGMQRAWFREQDRLEKERPEAPMRGAIFKLFRDDKMKPRTGNELEFVEFVDEDFISQYTRKWSDREGKENVEDCTIPYDYLSIMPEMSDQEIGGVLNIKVEPVAGSAADSAKYDNGDDDDDDGYEADGSLQGNYDDGGIDIEDDVATNDEAIAPKPRGRERSVAGPSDAPQRAERGAPRQAGTRRQRGDSTPPAAPQGRERTAPKARARAKVSPKPTTRTTRRK
jgi:hypothetical protein